ncbi:MAG: shikimate dehydrogenase [Bacteroidetes bacterium]|nr:shikimate dehydrogenase [Bacteroidota bacterium]
MNGRYRRFGLIGYPLEHSASALYFAKKFEREGLTDYSYTLFPLLSADEVRPLISNTPGLQGFNVTIPYKQSIIPFLDYLDPLAQEIGAVNTVTINRSGQEVKLKGYNTDAGGFKNSLSPDFNHTHALILGTGGSSKAVAYILKEMGIETLNVSRTKKEERIIRYEELTPGLLEKFTFIVNCTPAGMIPDTGSAPPLPFALLDPRHFVYDLIYKPVETKLLRLARESGARTQNGFRMLELQAELAFAIWMNESNDW